MARVELADAETESQPRNPQAPIADVRGGLILSLALMSASDQKAIFRRDRRMSVLVERPAHAFTTLLLRAVALFASLNAPLVVVLSTQQLHGRQEVFT